MAFLSPINATPLPAALHGEGVLLRVPALSDYAKWSHLRAISREFLTPWEPIWPIDDLTRLAFRRRIRRYYRDVRAGTGYPFFLFSPDGERLYGGLTLSNVRRGVTQCCTLGYWMGAPHAGKGLMTAGVRAVIPFVFDSLRLNRIEAACLPHNEVSIRLLQKVGFQREGYARRYLCINGRWQDHVLFGLVRGDEINPATR